LKRFDPDWQNYQNEIKKGVIINGNFEQIFETIQSAIDAAVDGDILTIIPEIYEENLTINKSITLKSEDEKNIILDGKKKGPVISIENAGTVSLFNLNLKNGKAENGGGIFVKNSNLNLENSIISENLGGGIYSFVSVLKIENSEIFKNENNGNYFGAGLLVNGGDLKLINSKVFNNSDSQEEISLNQNSEILIEN